MPCQQRAFIFVKKHVVFSTLLFFTAFLAACGGGFDASSSSSGSTNAANIPSGSGSAPAKTEVLRTDLP